MHTSIIPVYSQNDIPDRLRDTPVAALLGFHNFNQGESAYDKPQMLIGTCIDYRIKLHLPDNFAYVIRSAGANLRYSDFQTSFSIAVGGVRSIAIIGHSHCAMVKVEEKEDLFVKGLHETAGWSAHTAKEHFQQFTPLHGISDEVEFVLKETRRLRLGYPSIEVTPMFYDLESHKIHLIKE